MLSVALLNPPALTNLLDQHQSASATTGTAVAATPNLTLTNTNTSASIDIAALDPIGSFATSSSNDSATFTLTTNNTTGYTLSIAADDDNGSLLRPVDNPGDTPDSLESISSITTTSDFSARTQEAATSYNGKWGIRPSKYVDTNTTTPVDNTGDNPVYLPSPTASNPTILDKTTAANTNNTENSYTIALGVRADHTIHAGTYSRTFKLLAVANPVSYSIAFNQNTNDTVTNMPSTQSSDSITSTTVTLPSTVPVRAHYSFLGWCNLQPTTTNGIDSCTGTNPTTGAAATVYNPNGNGTNLTYGIDHTTTNNATLYAMWKIDTFTQTTEVRYENADGTWGSYSTVDTQTLNYGSSYSWSTAQINNFDSAAYQAASVSSYTVTEAHTNQVSIYRNTFTCTKQYRLENADGTWGAYTTGITVAIRYGDSCNYIATITDYRGSSSAANGAQGSTSAVVTGSTTLSLDFYRNTYSLTVSAGSNTSNPTGSGTYRWGQAVSVSVTKATNVTCTSYATPTWSQSGTAGTFSSTSGTSTTFTMGKGNATVTATSTASNVYQTITLSRSGGASGINIGGTNYTGSSVSLTCGTYNISGNYSSNYEFSSWSRSGSVTVANTASASTTMTVSGSGTLTLAGKQSCVSTITGTTMQSFSVGSTNYCEGATGTLTDSRSGNKTYTVAKIGDLIWMTKNLDLPGGITLTSSNSNISSNYTLPNSSTSGFSNENTAYVYNSNSTTCDKNSPCYSYYSYAAATAGTNPSSGEATSDICPKGWRLPTRAELNTIKKSYSGRTIVNSPFYGVYAGSYDSGNFYNTYGQQGEYWSSTANDASRAYSMYYYGYSPYSVGVSGSVKRVGLSIRCVAK